jgi:hypothetical protein
MSRRADVAAGRADETQRQAISRLRAALSSLRETTSYSLSWHCARACAKQSCHELSWLPHWTRWVGRPSDVNKVGPELHPANNITVKTVIIRFIVASQIGLDAFITQNPDWGTAEYEVCDNADVGMPADVVCGEDQ